MLNFLKASKTNISIWADFFTLLKSKQLLLYLFLADLKEMKRVNGIGYLLPLLSIFIHVAILGIVMSKIFNEDFSSFVLYFSISLAIWESISTTISKVSHLNDKLYSYVFFPDIPFLTGVLLVVFDFMLSFLLKLIAVLAINLIVNPDFFFEVNLFSVCINLVILSFFVFAWALPFGYLFDNFRFIVAFLPNLLFLIYLITPILWRIDRLEGLNNIIYLNVFYSLIQAVRAPFLGETDYLASSIVFFLSIIGCVFSTLIYTKNNKLICYRWLN